MWSFALGGGSVGLLFAIGGAALGLGLSVGGLAVGSIAVGGAAIGFVYAIGGGAYGPAIIDGRHCEEAAASSFADGSTCRHRVVDDCHARGSQSSGDAS